MNEIKVGLIGFGTIGTGVVKLLAENAALIENKLRTRLTLKKIADLDVVTDRGVALAPGMLTANVEEVLGDPEISVVVELIGGYEPARTFVLRAIANGKHIVTANKALLAVHGREIYAAAAEKGVEVLYEAAVGGGIPVLSAIKGNLAANRFTTVLGILNGTCNYILTKMTQEGADFAAVLKKAQELGYAEADPTFDIEGIDTAHKLAILLSLCFGTQVDFKEIHTEGISAISALDITFARDFGYKIKLLAITKMVNGEIEARVHPTMLPEEYPIATVDGVFNALSIVGDAVGSTMFYGRGAGDMPTGSAVVSDIIDIGRDVLTGCADRSPVTAFRERSKLSIRKMDDITSCYYLRFSAMDKPGVLSRITGVLGKNNISISSMIQKGRQVDEAVRVVMMTHDAVERDVRRALDEINKMDCVSDATVVIRVEEGSRG